MPGKGTKRKQPGHSQKKAQRKIRVHSGNKDPPNSATTSLTNRATLDSSQGRHGEVDPRRVEALAMLTRVQSSDTKESNAEATSSGGVDATDERKAETNSRDAESEAEGAACPHCVDEDNPKSEDQWQTDSDLYGVCVEHEKLCGTCTVANCIEGDNRDCKRRPRTGHALADPGYCPGCAFYTRGAANTTPSCVGCKETYHTKCDDNWDEDVYWAEGEDNYLCVRCEQTKFGKCTVCREITLYSALPKGRLAGLTNSGQDLWECGTCVQIQKDSIGFPSCF